jgi:hydroxymethylglutaryl-CoA synthase
MRNLRDRLYGQKPYKPMGSTDSIAKDTYYLEEIDDMYRRKYSVKE